MSIMFWIAKVSEYRSKADNFCVSLFFSCVILVKFQIVWVVFLIFHLCRMDMCHCFSILIVFNILGCKFSAVIVWWHYLILSSPFDIILGGSFHWCSKIQSQFTIILRTSIMHLKGDNLYYLIMQKWVPLDCNCQKYCCTIINNQLSNQVAMKCLDSCVSNVFWPPLKHCIQTQECMYWWG